VAASMSEAGDIVALMDEVASRALGAPYRDDGLAAYGTGARDTGIGVATDYAAQHAQMGTVLGPGTRFRFVKRILLRLAHLITKDQVAYNTAVIDALRSSEQHVQRLQALLATVDLNRQIGEERINRDADAIRAAVREISRRRDADRGELQVQRARVSLFLRELRELQPAADDLQRLQKRIDENADDLGALYAHLEERFRGSREEIRRRQTIYLEDVLPLRERGLPLLDIGPGRGEWLDLMREHGVPAYGVDTNRLFVEEGTRDGLDVRLGDGIEHLAGLEEGSVAAVSGFHVVEHVPFDVLQTLLQGALHALMPGGLLLVETPNPTNISVGATTFWLDPTHNRPVPPELLTFLVEEHGFVSVELRYPVWAKELHFAQPPLVGGDELRTLIDSMNRDFFGPRDYAVIARKPVPA